MIEQALAAHESIALKELEKWSPKAKNFGTYLYGSQNYKTDTTKSDVDTVTLFIPSLDFAVWHKGPVNKEIQLENGEKVVLKDIRTWTQGLMQGYPKDIELLLTRFNTTEYWRRGFCESYLYDTFVYLNPINTITHSIKMGLSLLDKGTIKGTVNAILQAEFLDNYVHGLNEDIRDIFVPYRDFVVQAIKEAKEEEWDEYKIDTLLKNCDYTYESLKDTFLYYDENLSALRHLTYFEDEEAQKDFVNKYYKKVTKLIKEND